MSNYSKRPPKRPTNSSTLPPPTVQSVAVADLDLPPSLIADPQGLAEFFSTHVCLAADGRPIAYELALQRPSLATAIPLKLKIQLEIGHWIEVFLDLADREGKSKDRLGPVIRESFEELEHECLGRTVRILRALDLLLTEGACDYPVVAKTVAKWRGTLDELDRTLDWSQPDRFLWATLNEDGLRRPARKSPRLTWHISLPLLLVRAAAWSQAGWPQPFLWEAYSALKARQEHEGNEWLRNPLALNTLAFLVRFQSAPGQFSRRSGDWRFGAELKSIVKNAPNAELLRKTLFLGLGVLAHAQEFRNRKLGPAAAPPHRAIEAQIVELGALRPHDAKVTDFAPFWKGLQKAPVTKRTDVTWCFAAWLAAGTPALSAAQLAKFKAKVLKRCSFEGKCTPVFSFDRDYLRLPRLRQALVRTIKASNKSQRRFTDGFTFRTARVPGYLADGREEWVTVVRLNEYSAAAHMVFAELSDPALQSLLTSVPIQPDATLSAWSLIEFLFRVAQDSGYVRVDDDRYVPVYLLSRMLDACHVLRPDDCVSVPVRMNGDFPFFLHLPIVPLDVEANASALHALLIQSIARYVPAYVLNGVVSGVVFSCDVGLDSLAATEAGEFWRDRINEEYAANHFDVLLGKYLDDYLETPGHVRLGEVSVRGDELSDEEHASPNLLAELRQLVDAECDGASSKRTGVPLLGVDIGGTFVKMGFFELRAVGRGGVKLRASSGDTLRVLTAKPAADRYSSAEEFCERFATEALHRQRSMKLPPARAVGLSWPGPVRANAVRGTSGILRLFPELTRDIVSNDIRKIMNLDIPKHTRRSLGAQCSVAMANDGDCHALGVLYDIFRQAAGSPSGPGDDATWVVIKAGTGTAGAVLENGQLRDGLMEFGKLLVNLAYTPSRTMKFPEGLGNLHCSGRTLPALATSLCPQLSRLSDRITSVEVGLLAALAPINRKKWREMLRVLGRECGAIVFAERLPSEVDAELVRQLQDQTTWQNNREARRLVETYLCLVGASAIVEFRRRVRVFGAIRLAEIFDLDVKQRGALADFLVSKTPRGSKHLTQVFTKVEEVASKAEEAVTQLGAHVGDIIALLADTYPLMDHVVLGGGVLSGHTLQTVRDAAIRRLQGYGFKFPPTANNAQAHPGVIAFRGGSQVAVSSRAKSSDSKMDPGVAGAAVCGALALLKEKRLDGLSEIRHLAQQMGSMDQLEVTDAEVRIVTSIAAVPGKADVPVRLGKCALTRHVVNRYLQRFASELGILHSTPSDDRTRYTSYVTK